MTVTEAGAVVEAPRTVSVAVAVAVAVPLKKSIMRRENKFNQSAHSMYDYHNSTAQHSNIFTSVLSSSTGMLLAPRSGCRVAWVWTCQGTAETTMGS